MSATIIFSRRGVHICPKDGRDYNALLVPSEDQLVVLRDLSISTDEIAQRVRAEGRVPLWREKRGQILVYGFLPPELKDIRQSLRVWLAEDYAPSGCSAFFFVLGNWVVHGVKELDDERRETWRSAVLTYPAATIVEDVATAAADLLLRFPAKEICVAVDGGLDRQEQFKRAMEAIEVPCLPFAALRAPSKLPSLYRHRDFGTPMMLSLGFLMLLFVGMLVHLMLGYIESSRLQGDIGDIRRKIQSVQINKNIGYIHEPQPILAEMRKAIPLQPSAILDAAARFGRAMGDLNEVEFTVGPSVDINTSGLIPVIVKFNKIFDKLLVNQEHTTNQLLPQVPWIRSVAGVPEGSGLRLLLNVQIAAPKGSHSIPSATMVFQPPLDAPTEIGQSVSLTISAEPQPAPAQPVAPVAATAAAPEAASISTSVPALPEMPLPPSGGMLTPPPVISSTPPGGQP